jgi:hypothetical protein
MLIFSPLARQLIDHAVAETLDPKQGEIWTSWIKAHPHLLRRAGEPWDDGTGPTPKNVLDIALNALLAFAQRKKAELSSSNLSEDDRLDIEGDLTHIASVVRFIALGRSGRTPGPHQTARVA